MARIGYSDGRSTPGTHQVHIPGLFRFWRGRGGLDRTASETDPNGDYPACRQAGPILGMGQQPAAGGVDGGLVLACHAEAVGEGGCSAVSPPESSSSSSSVVRAARQDRWAAGEACAAPPRPDVRSPSWPRSAPTPPTRGGGPVPRTSPAPSSRPWGWPGRGENVARGAVVCWPPAGLGRPGAGRSTAGRRRRGDGGGAGPCRAREGGNSARNHAPPSAQLLKTASGGSARPRAFAKPVVGKAVNMDVTAGRGPWNSCVRR